MPILEAQAIVVKQIKQISRLSLPIYIIPFTCCPPGHEVNLEHLPDIEDCIIRGDVNAHPSSWFFALNYYSRGTAISEQIGNSYFGILNEALAFRVTINCQGSPNISLVSLSLLPAIDWLTKLGLFLEHVPILLFIHRTVTRCKSIRRSG